MIDSSSHDKGMVRGPAPYIATIKKKIRSIVC